MARSLPSPRHRFPAVASLSGAPIRLFLTSATILFVELLLIRWIPANVKYIGYFSNFILMSSFLGIGLGILLGRRGVQLPASPFPVLLLATTTLVTVAQLNIQFGGENEIFFGVDLSNSADVNYLVLPLIVVLCRGDARGPGLAARAAPALDAAAQGLRDRHRRVDGAASPPSRSCRCSARTRSSGSRSSASCCCSWRSARDRRSGRLVGGLAMTLVVLGSINLASRREGRLVAVLPGHRVPVGPTRRVGRSQATATSRYTSPSTASRTSR